MSLVTFQSGLEFHEFVGEVESFDLGVVSFRWLDSHDVFDRFQEDDDEYSDIIFKTSKENVLELSEEIVRVANCDDGLRDDIRVKLILFAEFVRNSNGLICKMS